MQNDKQIDRVEGAFACEYHVLRAALISAAIINTLAVSLCFRVNLAHPWVGHVRKQGTPSVFPLAMFSGLDGTMVWVTLLAACLVALVGSLLQPRSAGLLCCGTWLYANMMERAWWTQDGGTNALWILLMLLVAADLFKGLQMGLPWTSVTFSTRDLILAAARVQVVLIYGVAVIAKLQGRLWVNGMALFYIFQNPSYGAPWARHLILQFPEISTVLCYATIGWQLSFVFLVWNQRMRLGFFLTSLAFHLAIAVTMNLWSFAFTMMLIDTCFLPKDYCRAVCKRVARVLPGRRLSDVGASR